MRLPEIIPIKHVPHYRTELIGRYPGGQFFADITGAYQDGVQPGEDWRQQMRCYSLVHRFDADGHHLRSDIWFAGVRADPGTAERAERKLSEWIAAMAPITFGDIAVRPFQLVFDGVLFGLVDETEEDPDEGHGGPWAELYPQGLGFHEPWDGEYDT